MSKHKWQFSNATARSAEARLNAQEARKLVAPHVPEHLKEKPEPKASNATNACFRRVTDILAGKGRK